MKLQTHDLNYLLGKNCFGDDVSQSMFVYQTTVDTLEDKGTEYVLTCKSKGLYASKLKPLCTAFLYSKKLSGYKMGKKFDGDPLAAEQTNCTTKIGNAYVFHVLDDQPRNPTNNSKF